MYAIKTIIGHFGTTMIGILQYNEDSVLLMVDQDSKIQDWLKKIAPNS